MQNAFDDLNDQTENEDEYDECSMKHATNQRNPGNMLLPKTGINDINVTHKRRLNNNDHDAAAVVVEVLHLKNVLASKEEEIRNITAEFNSERVKLQCEIDNLKKRNIIIEADKASTNMNRQHEHELFVECKQRLLERDETISELNAKIKSLDESNLELMAELERTKRLLNDIHEKYRIVEKDITTGKQTDNIVKQIKDQHAAQIDMMQQQINTMRTKLEDREGELKRLMIQNNELHKSREHILVDKSDTINELTKRLDETQRQCQGLLIKQAGSEDLTQEKIRLMRKNTQLEQQLEEMQHTINNLTAR